MPPAHAHSPAHRPGSKAHDRASLAAHRIGQGPGITRPAPKHFDAGQVLKRTGFRLADEGRAARSDVSKAAGAAGKIGAGDFLGSGMDFVLVVVGSLLGLLLLDLLISSRGSTITSAGVKWTGGLLSRLVSPTDPLTTPGAPGQPAQAVQVAPSGTSVTRGTTAAPWVQYAGPLYPTPSGRLSPVPGTTHEIDSSYVLFAQWIEKTFGVTVTSGYRTAAENAAAGGAEKSDHLHGVAADFGGPPAALNRLAAWASGFGFPYVETPAQAVAAGEGPHVHISFFRPSSS